MLDLTHKTLLEHVQQLQAERGLNNCEMELILTQVLNDIKTAKENDYAETILDLVYEIQQQEARDNEPVMTPIEGSSESEELDTSNMKMSDMNISFDKMEFTPDQIIPEQE